MNGPFRCSMSPEEATSRRHNARTHLAPVVRTRIRSLTATKSVLNIYTQLRTMFGVAQENDFMKRSPTYFTIDRVPLLMGTRLGGFLAFTLMAGGVSVACALVSWHPYPTAFTAGSCRFCRLRRCPCF
jgi:hypothetical protein